eukprot:gene5823-6064_t
MELPPVSPARASRKEKSSKFVRPIIVPDAEDSGATDALGGPADGHQLPHTPASPTLRSKSMRRKPTASYVGAAAEQPAGGSSAARHVRITMQASRNMAQQPGEVVEVPQLRHPVLGLNSTALKWDGLAPEATRAAVAGLLSQLVLLPGLCEAISQRLGASRLSALLVAVFGRLEASSGKAGKAKKKKAAKLVLLPEQESLLGSCCACLKFLVAGSNVDCFRVAAAGCLPYLVQLSCEAGNNRLRQSAQAVLSQVALLSQVQCMLLQAQAPEELLVPVHMKLTAQEVKELLIEFPNSLELLQPDEDAAAY